MDLVSYVKMVSHYRDKYKLKDWQFSISWLKEGVEGRGYGQIGVTYHDKKKVVLHGSFILNNKRAWVREVLLHEIAHVLDPRDGIALTNTQAHDDIFSMTCMRIGAVWWIQERFFENYNTPLRVSLFESEPVI